MSNKYKYMRIRLASPEEILSWSHGEVKTHETINYRTLKPEPGGLFCEKIFGPTKDYQCSCGKQKRNDVKGKVCEKCGVEITSSKVRRERMGHIKLASPVVHTWFLRNSPSRLAILLDIKAKDLEEVVYLASYIVINPGHVPGLVKKQILTEGEYSDYTERYPKQFEALTGAEAVKKLLQELDLVHEVEVLRKKLRSASTKQKRDRIIKRLEVVESFNNSDNKPEWMVLEVLPVIPPDLRPMVQLDGGRFATTDLNDLYRRILNRNNRLKRQYEQNAPHLIVKNEKRMLQEAVDALIDNSKRGKKAAVEKNHHLKSLSDLLRGKQGRFRQNLLGKRVDYSGRSVIVVGPNLKMYQCGLPKEMALTLFKPFVIRQLTEKGYAIGAAKRLCERQDDVVWPILESVIREHPILLNRAPTLHRLGIQAFEPILIEGKAIRLHPLVCTAFNADFDGDQMAVHVPLSQEAQAEARLLMIASNNILNPKDGKPVVTPSQDMILGNYYLSLERAGEKNEGHFYRDFEEAYIAYKNNEITLHTRVFVDPKSYPAQKFAGKDLTGKYLLTTVGKMIFNTILPDEFPYINEPTKYNLQNELPDCYFLDIKKNTVEEMLARPETAPFIKKTLSMIIAEVFDRFKTTETSIMLDRLKDQGFKYSTISGISISIADIEVYDRKDEEIKAAEAKVDQIHEMCDMGLLTEKERYQKVCSVWSKTRDSIESGLWENLKKKKDNPIFMMADSGSRGSKSNFAQLAGMRGLMANTNGQAIEVPVKANFFQGLNVSEFFISSHGSRKGSTDTALKTAESGYLTRRLVDVSQDIIVTSEDCGTEKGFKMEDIVSEEGKVVLSLADRLIGRYLAKDIIDENSGEIIAHRNEFIDEALGAKIAEAGIKTAFVRTNLTCNAKTGVCMKCYGRNLATNEIVEVGEAVGTIAAQSIGEPGTQLTMRTFHNGGVASGGDITQGLPRVQELFEARKPKGKATLSEINGVVKDIQKTKAGVVISIIDDTDPEDESKIQNYTVEATAELIVKKGDHVSRGQKLMKGSIHPKELLRITDAYTTQKYIIEEVQKVYRSQGVEIADKHIEIIVHQMMRKLSVVQEGSTHLLPGLEVSVNEFRDACKEALENKGSLPIAKPLILGITKAALGCDSFLSACSFQETTRILTDAAIKGKKDNLLGLKENVIIGGLIPAGTGILREKSFECQHRPEEPEDNLDENGEAELGSDNANLDDDLTNDANQEIDEAELDDVELDNNLESEEDFDSEEETENI